MRITEKMGLVYTALFLTVSVAVITQNSDSLMATFRGESDVVAVNDVFTVIPGARMRLPVLSNDVHANKVPNSAIIATSQPQCGKIEKQGGSFVYSNTRACGGQQTFTYCLKTGDGCKSASVLLKINNSRAVVETIATGPALSSDELGRQAEINSMDLEISNIRLGKVAAKEKTTKQNSGMKLAKVALELQADIRRPTAPGARQEILGVTKMAPDALFGSKDAAHAIVEVAAIDDQINDASALSANLSVTLPSEPPMVQTGLNRQPIERAEIVARMARIDLSLGQFTDHSVFDNSPFGTDCSADLTSAVLTGGIVELTLLAPCHPNSRVEIYHGKLVFAMRTGHTGNLTVKIPALEKAAHFMLVFADGTKLKIGRTVDDLEQLERVAVQWNGPSVLNLHANEFGAKDGARGHIWAGNPGTIEQSNSRGGGYTVSLGDMEIDRPERVQIYSLPLNHDYGKGVVQLAVEATPSGAACGTQVLLRTHHSKAGRLVGSSGYSFEMPACGAAAQSILLNNAVRDLMIAGR